MARAADGGLRGDHLGRRHRAAGRQAGRGGQPGGGDHAAPGGARFSDLLADWTAALGGRLVRYEPLRPRAGPGGQPPGLRPRRAAGARLRQGQVHRLVRRRLPGDLAARRSSTSAASPESPRVRRRRRGQVRLRRAADGPHRPQRRRVASRSGPAPRRRWRSRWPTCCWPSGATRRPACASRARRLHARAWRPQETGLAGRADRAARAGVRRGPAQPRGRRRHRRAARGADRGLRRGQPAQLRRRQHRRDGPLRRRPADRRRLRRAGPAGQAMDAGQVAVLLVHDANPAYTLPKSERLRRPRSRRWGSRSRPRCTSTRPRRCATSCCRSITRWSAGTTCARGPACTG